MALNFEHITQWQTMRVVTANDVPLTQYAPGDLSAAVKAKMTKVAPATMLLIQPLVLGDNNGTFTLTLSGWMDHGKNDPRHGGPGPGLRLVTYSVAAGNRAWTSDIPHNDGKWGAAAAWRICDTAGITGSDFAQAFVKNVLDQDLIIFFPTLGYSYLLPEISALTNITKVGLLYRAIAFGDVVVKTDYMRPVPAT